MVFIIMIIFGVVVEGSRPKCYADMEFNVILVILVLLVLRDCYINTSNIKDMLLQNP